MGRLRRFPGQRFIGVRDGMIVYDCDDDGQFAELEQRLADEDLLGRSLAVLGESRHARRGKEPGLHPAVTPFIDIHVHPPASVLIADGFRPVSGSGRSSPKARPVSMNWPTTTGSGTASLSSTLRCRFCPRVSCAHQRAARPIDRPVLRRPDRSWLCRSPSGRGSVGGRPRCAPGGTQRSLLPPACPAVRSIGSPLRRLWDMAEELALPVVVHCGTTDLGRAPRRVGHLARCGRSLQDGPGCGAPARSRRSCWPGSPLRGRKRPIAVTDAQGQCAPGPRRAARSDGRAPPSRP